MKISRMVLGAVLLLIALLSGSVFTVLAFSGVTITIPGAYGRGSVTCGGGASIQIKLVATQLTDDGGNRDYYGLITFDGDGHIIDGYVYSTSASQSVPATVFITTIPGYTDLPDPVSRPFTTVIYDVPADPGGPGSVWASYIQANGTEVASTTFDPSFVPGCAKLPLVGGVCPALPDGSVVGDTPFQTQAYWAPGKVSPGVFINPGTYWVIGQDDTHQYYEIMLSCQFLWVPVQNMQPSYQPPWSGQPLPTRVVGETAQDSGQPSR